jgi:hypothetical protein
MVDKSAQVDWRIARIARGQHGIITTVQLACLLAAIGAWLFERRDLAA